MATLNVALSFTVLLSLLAGPSYGKTQLQDKNKLLALLRRLDAAFSGNEDAGTSDEDATSSEAVAVDPQTAWEHARMFIINGSTERHVDDYKPWLNIPPENRNGQTDEILTHSEKVRLNLESETEEDREGDESREKRKFLYPKGDSNLWRNGIVLYRFATDSRKFVNQKSYSLVMAVMKWYEENTCTQWREATPQMQNLVGHDNYVEIGGGVGCSANVGMTGRGPKRTVTLQESSCISFTTIAHELGHCLGMHHEHVRSDRDQYVDIVWNVLVEKPGGVNWGKSNTVNYAPYDFGSVMHYSLYAGSQVRGEMAIVPKQMELDFLATTHRPSTMSFYDLLALNFVYKCADNCNPEPSCTNGGFPDKKCECVCPETLIGNQCENIMTDSTCGGVINLGLNEEVKISSPNYPANYAVGSNCGWLIRGPELSYISLDITALDIPPGRGFNMYTGNYEDVCSHHLEVRYNLIGQPGPRFCGKDWDQGVRETTTDGQANLMMVRFDSTETSATGSGFRATIKAKQLGCRSNPCQNGASCTDRKTGPSCRCPKGFAGDFCELLGSARVFCDMDDETDCHFDNDKSAPQQWQLVSGGTPSSGTGPSSGYGGSGKYAYMEGSHIPAGDTARLISTLMKPGVRCLEFYYHMNGRDMGELAVKVLEDGRERVEYERVGNQGPSWLSHQMTIMGTKPFRIIFEATRGTDFQSDIALDNIKVETKYCKGDRRKMTKAPFTKAPSTKSPTTRLATTKRPTTKPPTTKPPTTMPPTFTQKPTTTSPSDCSSYPCQNGATCVDRKKGPICQCPKGFSGDFCELLGSATFFCDMDDNTNCHLGNDNLVPLKWRVISGGTPSSGTGPSSGYGGSGQYAYVEATRVNPGDKARLVSTLINPGVRCLEFYYHMNGHDMGELAVKVLEDGRERVEYERVGNQGPGWLSHQMTVMGTKPFRLIFEATRGPGFQSDIALDNIRLQKKQCKGQRKTKPSSTQAPATKAPPVGGCSPGMCRNGGICHQCQVAAGFRCICPQGYTGSRCETKVGGCGSVTCQNGGTCHNSNRPGGFVCACANGYTGSLCDMLGSGNHFCYFGNNNACPFKVDRSSQMTWEVNTGRTPTARTGPRSGFGNRGPYLYVNAASASAGQTAAFTSELLSAGPWCLQFYYHMYGSTMGSLALTVVQGTQEHVVSVVSGNKGDKWRRKEATIDSNIPYRMKIVAVRGPGPKSDIAIDSVKLYRCGQTSVSKRGVLPETLPQLPPEPEASFDEITCTFDDQTLCKFSQINSDDIDWKLKHGPTPTQVSGPLGDHTGSGYYLTLEPSDSMTSDRSGVIISDSFTFGDTETVCLRFWYHIEGATPATLRVHKLWLQDSVIGKIDLWTSDGTTSTKWRQAEVTVTAFNHFRVVFEGTLAGQKGRVGLDDVSIEAGAC